MLATITYIDRRLGLVFLQDPTDGIFAAARTPSEFPGTLGDTVSVTAVSDPGEYAPILINATAKLVNHGHMPVANRDAENIFMGRRDCQWVELEGVVEQVFQTRNDVLLNLVWGNHKFKVNVVAPFDQIKGLIDANVKIQGVAASLFNDRRKFLGVHLFVPGMRFIRSRSAPLSDPFRLDVVSGGDLQRFSKDKDFAHRVHVRGTVIFASASGPTWIRDDSSGIEIESHEPATLRVGDIVDAVGFPETGTFGAVIRGGTLRHRIATSTVYHPVLISAAEASSGKHESQLVQVDGTLTERREGLLEFHSSKSEFTAVLPKGELPSRLERGAMFRVTGICVTLLDDSGNKVEPTGFRVLLRSRDDLGLVRNAPWFTSERLSSIILVTGGLGLAALIWVLLLRRTVRYQTGTLTVALQRAQTAESVEQDRKNVLELVVRNKPLSYIMQEIVRSIESRWVGVRCSIQLQLAEGARLSCAPSLSSELALALEQIDPSQPGTPALPVPQAFLTVPVVSEMRQIGMIIALFETEPPAAVSFESAMSSWGDLAGLAVERLALHEELSFHAHYDVLTGLYNRRALTEKLDRELSASIENGQSVGLLYADLDGFKQINDLYGHEAGDMVLKQVAARIRAAVRRSDIVARVGGDEFVIVLNAVRDRAEAERIASLVASSLELPIRFDGHDLVCEASIGVSIYPEEAHDRKELLTSADHCMYSSKSVRKAQAYL